MTARTVSRGLGAALLVLAGGSLLLPAAADADEARSLVMGASAQGMRIGYSVPDQFAVSQFVDGGGPVAQVSLDSTGKAVGFGSLPYPGENAVAAPGVLTLASGLPIPQYPFYAEASHPVTPSSEVNDPSGTYTVAAKAQHQKAEGLAALHFGGADKPVSRLVSQAAGGIDADGATVTATSIGEGFAFGDGLLTIASGTSRSVTTYKDGAAKPETTSELIIEGAKVGDQAVTIGPDGVHPAGQKVPYPGGADQLNQTLAAAGITVRTLSPQNGEGAATAEALQVVVKHPIPGSNVSGTLVYEFGGSASFIAFGAAGPGLPALPGDLDPAPATTAGPHAVPASAAAAPAGADTADGRAARDAASGTAPSSGASGLLSSPITGGTPLSGGTGGDPSAAAPAALSDGPPGTTESALTSGPQPAVLARADLKQPGRVLMGVLAAAGAILLAASTLWRNAL